MKLSQFSKILLTVLYSVSLIYFSWMIFGGSESSVAHVIISYPFYAVTVLAALKGFADVVTRKEKSDLLFLILAITPLLIWMLYLMLSAGL